MSTRVITVRAERDFAAAAAEGAEALAKGKLVGFATETVYGIAVLATCEDAIRRLRQVKDRPTGPFSVHVHAPSAVDALVRDVPLRAQWLMQRAWPGPVTVLLETGGKLADDTLNARDGLFETLTQDGVIGLRCPDEPVATRMLAGVEGPVVAPSANAAGAASPRNADDVLRGLGGRIDLLIDSGPSRHGKDSTIVRFSGNDWEMIREGVVDLRMLESMMHRKILFVCTGNTCRSPMAAGLAKKLLAQHLGCGQADLADLGVHVQSAGLYAAGGSPAAPEAIEAAGRRGADIAGHRSKKLSSELIKSADVVFCMTSHHVADCQRLAGSASGRVRLLDDLSDVPDPIGGGADVYDRTAEHIEQSLGAHRRSGLL